MQEVASAEERLRQDVEVLSKNEKRDGAGVDRKDFMKILTKQLQNQSPQNPTDSSKLMDQMTGMQNLRVLDKLSNTIDDLKKFQSISSAGNMIGKEVTGQNTEGDPVKGVVDRVKVEGEKVFLSVGDSKVPSDSITEISSVEPNQ